MQKLDEQKRRAILDVAAKLFATRAFHEVRLDDVAQQARIGKGTVYIYFKSKDDLFASLIHEGFGTLVEKVQALLKEERKQPAIARIETVVRELAQFAKAYPHFFQLMRDHAEGQKHAVRDIRKNREQLGKLIAALIRQGIEAGELDDPNPDLTGQFFPACVRSAIVYGGDIAVDQIVEHVMRILTASLTRSRAADVPNRDVAPPKRSRKSTLQSAKGAS